MKKIVIITVAILALIQFIGPSGDNNETAKTAQETVTYTSTMTNPFTGATVTSTWSPSANKASSSYSGFGTTATSIKLPCSRCSGSGRVSCSSCHGTGSIERTYFTPQYSGVGTGSAYNIRYESCSVCSGTGRSLCVLCGGTGY